ncbi:MAG: tRNA uridine-5-carboxymethylaminomethyl(34) synthesis GTPase MnmE [Sphingomicrobium sp.]
MGRRQDDLGGRASRRAGARPLTDTIFALSSGRPPAAVGVIRTSGPAAFAAAEAISGPLPQPRHASLRALRDPTTKLLLDHALVLRFDAPASATGENIVEYQCHGGRAVVDAIVATIAGMPGMRAAEAGEFTRRAFANGRIDLTEAEGLADLLEAETETQRRAALQNADGGLRRQVENWRNRVIMLSARAEAAIDYTDEDEIASDDSSLRTDALGLCGELSSWLARPRIDTLKAGVRVVAAGPPNVGKSSLINVLCGHDRAIVTEIAGTTRDVIEVPIAIGGIPFVLVDTAGLRPSEDQVEQIGVSRARSEAERSDILLWLGDPDEAPAHRSTILLRPRADLARNHSPRDSALPVSSMTGEGISRLIELMSAAATNLLPHVDEVSLNRRQATHLDAARNALEDAGATQLEVVADALRRAREAFDAIAGRAGVEEMLDGLFGRFCLGK